VVSFPMTASLHGVPGVSRVPFARYRMFG
jgi:hypothetical protein